MGHQNLKNLMLWHIMGYKTVNNSKTKAGKEEKMDCRDVPVMGSFARWLACVTVCNTPVVQSCSWRGGMRTACSGSVPTQHGCAGRHCSAWRPQNERLRAFVKRY